MKIIFTTITLITLYSCSESPKDTEFIYTEGKSRIKQNSTY